MQLQPFCHNTLPWLISFSLDLKARYDMALAHLFDQLSRRTSDISATDLTSTMASLLGALRGVARDCPDSRPSGWRQIRVTVASHVHRSCGWPWRCVRGIVRNSGSVAGEAQKKKSWRPARGLTNRSSQPLAVVSPRLIL